MDGSGYGNTLGPAQLQHALYIFIEERGFNCKFMGLILDDQLGNFLVYQVQSFVIIFFGGESHRLHFAQYHAPAMHFNNAISHLQGSRINTQNYFGSLLQEGHYFYRMKKTGQPAYPSQITHNNGEEKASRQSQL